jgi:hypothetical protein
MNCVRSLLLGVVCLLASSSAFAQHVIAEIPVPSRPPEIMALNEVTHRVYTIGAGESGPRVLSAVDMTTHTLLQSMGVPIEPRAIAVDSGLNRVYVGGSDYDGIGKLLILDGATLEVLATVSTPQIEGLAVNSVTHRIYAKTNVSGGFAPLTVFDEYGSELAGLAIQVKEPVMTVDPARNLIYLAGANRSGDRLVERINGDTHEILEPFLFPHDHDLMGFAFNPVSNHMAGVFFDINGQVVVIVLNGEDGTISSTTAIDVDPLAISVSSVTDRVYVVGYSRSGTSTAQRIVTLDAGSGAVVSDNPILMEPYAVAVDAEMNRLFAVGFDPTGVAGTVFVVDLQESQQDIGAPTLNVPGNIDAEAMFASGAEVTFTVSAIDDVDGEVAVTCSHESGAIFPIGVTTVECSAVDAAGNIATDAFSVAVFDTTAPAIASVTPSKTHLWPPNQELVPVTFAVSSTDAVSAPSCQIGVTDTSQQASDPTDMFRDGPLSMRLRAERETGVDRIYSIQIICRDAAGNTALQWTTVTVGKP